MLSARAARKLGLWKFGEGSDYYVKGHGGRRGCYTAQKFWVALLDESGKVLREVKVSSYEDPCGDLQIEDWSKLKNNWTHLQDLPLPQPIGDGVVDLILGSAALDLMEARNPVRFGPPGGPVAKFTSLGWIVGGRTQRKASPEAPTGEGRINFSLGGRNAFNELQLEHDYEKAELKEQYRCKENELKRSLNLLWGTKECCRKDIRNHSSPAIETPDDTLARKKFEQSITANPSGRLEVGLIWRDKTRPSNNAALALKIFFGMERQMKNRPGLWEEFSKNVNEWVEAGYARLLDFHRKGEGFFIPTFMVIREDKATTKYRLIVNGKFQFGQKSINDYLLSGPNVMNRLADVLIRFRHHKYVLTCDVSHMFLRIGVPEKDRRFLRFFFRDENKQIRIVEMCSHAFGLTQSPFVVINAVKTHAEKEKENTPLAAKAVLEDSIVDDILTGCRSFGRLETLKNEIEQLYSKIQMTAHKWATNSPKLRESLLPGQTASAVNLGQDNEALFCSDGGEIPSIKCLGILWHPETDKLQFFSDPSPDCADWTMRKISSRTSRLFDPLGLVCPLMLEGKLLMQSLWKLGIGWDEEVPSDVSSKYNRWLKRVSTSHLSHIPRRVKAPFKSKFDQLLIFTDASSQAQAAVAYLWSCGQDQAQACLWAAKQKISSLNKAESISHLELEGASMGVELARQICKAMKWDMNNVLYFTDSTTVLWWLRTYRELDVFIGNRVCRVLDGSRVEQWLHVRTHENPADIPTRGMSGKKLAGNSLWWEGPSFLKRPRSSWPEQPEVVETRECWEGYRREEKRRVEGWLMMGVKNGGDEVDARSGWRPQVWYKIVVRFSRLEKGFRVARIVLRFLGLFTRFYFSINDRLVNQWLQLIVFKSVQMESLGDLVSDLRRGKTVSKEFLSLKPYLDQDGIVRVGGRLKHSNRLPFAVRSPVLLDGKHAYVRRLMEHIHGNVLRHCGGKNTLIAEVRWRVWVIGVSSLAKAIIKNCVHCNRSLKTQPVRIGSAPLHFTRFPLSKGCAFFEIGIDMAGPFFAKHGRSRAVSKRFVLLFVCCWTRALSLEVMDGASTESCVLAFLRHCNTFGFPRYVNSDRGTNLVGLDRHLQDRWQVLETEFKGREKDFAMIKWNFNPPYSPRFSGHVETMVKVMKNSLKKILGQPQYLFRDEQLYTLIKIVQGYANLRPLTTPSDDPNDPPSLTPADFLLTGSRVLGGIPEIDHTNYDLKTRKESLGKATREMWEALNKEYLAALQAYPKVRGEKELKAGMIVLMLDKTLPSGKYCLGKIKDVNPGPDGKGRTFDVERDGKILKRSAMTLAPLEVLQ